MLSPTHCAVFAFILIALTATHLGPSHMPAIQSLETIGALSMLDRSRCMNSPLAEL
jgi:hypothetical protein